MPKKLTIYIFGNELLDFDNLPIKLVPELKKTFPTINFIIQDPNENIKFNNSNTPTKKNKPSAGRKGLPSEASAKEGELIIIDTVMGINKVTEINDIEKLETEKIYSMHDFDLAFNLKLLKKVGQLEKLAIFGVPPSYLKEKTLEELTVLIKNLINCHIK